MTEKAIIRRLADVLRMHQLVGSRRSACVECVACGATTHISDAIRGVTSDCVPGCPIADALRAADGCS